MLKRGEGAWYIAGMSTAPDTSETPDYALGLFVCAKPGHEFASVGSSGVLVSLIATQGFAMLFLIPVVGFFALRNLAGASALVAGIGAGVLMGLLSLLLGGWGGVLKATGFMGYALTGAGMVGGLVSAELIWPVYLRIVPGRLDIFRYGFLGSGKPEVETHDLKVQGVCMDFGTYTMALEPERPVGERLPKLERGKRWPYGQVLPSDFQPRYLCLALVVGRLEIAQRVIQAARTDEATPVVSETELMG